MRIRQKIMISITFLSALVIYKNISENVNKKVNHEIEYHDPQNFQTVFNPHFVNDESSNLDDRKKKPIENIKVEEIKVSKKLDSLSTKLKDEVNLNKVESLLQFKVDERIKEKTSKNKENIKRIKDTKVMCVIMTSEITFINRIPILWQSWGEIKFFIYNILKTTISCKQLL